MTFGEKLKKLRESRKLTQTQMADMLGVSLRTYQYYESGRMYPKDKAVYQRTATRFNVTMDSLLGDQDLFHNRRTEQIRRARPRSGYQYNKGNGSTLRRRHTL